MASVHLYLLHQYPVFFDAGYPGTCRDCVGTGKGKSVLTARETEDRSDTDIVIQIMESAHFLVQNAGAFEIP
jgi:hypothetical protein